MRRNKTIMILLTLPPLVIRIRDPMQTNMTQPLPYLRTRMNHVSRKVCRSFSD